MHKQQILAPKFARQQIDKIAAQLNQSRGIGMLLQRPLLQTFQL